MELLKGTLDHPDDIPPTKSCRKIHFPMAQTSKKPVQKNPFFNDAIGVRSLPKIEFENLEKKSLMRFFLIVKTRKSVASLLLGIMSRLIS